MLAVRYFSDQVVVFHASFKPALLVPVFPSRSIFPVNPVEAFTFLYANYDPSLFRSMYLLRLKISRLAS